MSAEERNNYRFCYALTLILFAELLIQDGNFLIRQLLGVSDTSRITLLYYLGVFVYLLFSVIQNHSARRVVNDTLLYVLLLFVFGLSYLFFSNSREYYTQNVIIVLVFYLPVSIYAVKNITNFDVFFEIAKPYTYASVIVSLAIVLFFDYSKIGNYMEFSYALLPFSFLAYYELRKRVSIINIILTTAVIFTLLVYGSRAAVMFLLLFILIYEMFFHSEQVNKRRIFILVIGAILLFVVWLSWDYIEIYLLQFATNYNSRFLTKLLNNELLLSKGRESLAIRSREAISKMGLRVYGIFGDRQFLNGVYSHNIIYETLLSFGWILGILLMLKFCSSSAKILFAKHQKHIKLLYVLFFLCLFAKFSVSASFMESGNFFIFVAIIIALRKQAIRRVGEGSDE